MAKYGFELKYFEVGFSFHINRIHNKLAGIIIEIFKKKSIILCNFIIF